MKNLSYVALILLSFLSNLSVAQDQEHTFSFRLVSTPGYIELHSEEGCNWLSLSFSLWKGGDAVYINQDGMLGSNPDKLNQFLGQSDFLLKVERGKNGLTIYSYKGTSWSEFEDTCNDQYCSVEVNQKSAHPSH